MKTSALFTAIAVATLNAGTVQAVTPITPGTQLVANGFDISAACPGTLQPFMIAGVTVNQMQITGEICIEPNGTGVPPLIRLDFNTVTGGYSGASPVGTRFGAGFGAGGGGSIQIAVQTTSGWMPYAMINLSMTSIDCYQRAPGPGIGLGNTGITGLQITGGTIVAPGFWTNISNRNRSICQFPIFGTPTQLFIQ